MCHYHLY
ncbi:unnamed protein product [Acanthoscelides obtectus]|nr:unnamed protein product [Acanthoscelides obtectus]CAK1652092.1 hypothetical protein AOBTE_LOCUS17675 [Acanthoscelides obtectus]